MTVADTILCWLSIALSVGAIALSIDAMRLTRKADRMRAATASPKPTIPRFATIGDCMTAAYRLEFLPGDRIGCAHCPWIGNSAPQFAGHLLTCGDTDEGNRPVKVMSESPIFHGTITFGTHE